MKDILKSKNKKYMSNNTNWKAMQKIMRLSSIKSGTQNYLLHFLKIIASQCTCLTDTSCFATYKNGIILFKVPKKQKKQKTKTKKNTENIDPKISATRTSRAMILSKRAICGSKKSRFIKHQEAK